MPGTSRTVLPNGLTVLVREDHGAPVVAITTWVNAGYFDEPDPDVGISHVLEHMYFKGTSRRGVGAIARETKASGGYLNAHTIYDHTSYETVLPSSGFVRGLEIQADAYANSVIDAGELARELEVIVQEARRKRDTPASVAVESLYELLYDRHRIRRWRIGSEDGLRALNRDRMLGFYRRYYKPGNTILVIVGDVNTTEAIDHATRLYGHLPPAAVDRDVGPVENTTPLFRFREMAGDVAQSQVVFGWRTPGAHHEETPALDMASSILSDGRGSRLYRGVRERELASSVSAMNYTPRDVGVFLIRSEGDAGRAAQAAGAIWRHVAALCAEAPSAHELERVRRLFEARWLRRQETMEGQADFLAEWEAFGGWERSEAYFERMMTLSAEEVRSAVERHCVPDQASFLVYRPRTSPEFADSADAARRVLDTLARETADVAQAQPVAPIRSSGPRHRVELERRVGAVAVYRSSSGMAILVRKRAGAPIVHLGFYTSHGAASEPASLAGVGTLVARTSVKGTASRDADAIAAASELLGGSIGTSVAADSSAWTFSVPVTRYAEAAGLLSDVVQHPRFEAASVDTERGVMQSQLAQVRDDMYRHPVRLAFEAAFGDHPYGRLAMGTEETVAEISQADVRSWHESAVRSSNGVAAVAGDGEEHELAQILADAFPEIAPRAGSLPAQPSWPVGRAARVDQRDKAQTALALAFPGPSRRDGRRFAVSLLAGVASGLGGRFFDELRDKRSLAYTVHAWGSERLSAGLFVAYIATDPAREDEAREGLLAECQRFRDEPVTDEELTRARTFQLGSNAIARQGGSFLVSEMVDAYLLGTGLEEIEDHAARLSAVTAADIQAFAQAALDPTLRVEGIVRGRQA
jgi:zinc protease